MYANKFVQTLATWENKNSPWIVNDLKPMKKFLPKDIQLKSTQLSKPKSPQRKTVIKPKKTTSGSKQTGGNGNEKLDELQGNIQATPHNWQNIPAFSMKHSHFSASFTFIIKCSGAYKFEKETAWKNKLAFI